MTFNDIKKEVCALGFEESIADSDSFLAALRRALCSIYAERSVHAEIRFYKSTPPPSLHLPQISHGGGESVKINASRGSYSFYASGTGEFLLCDGDGEKRYSFDTQKERFSGVVSNGGYFLFTGDFSYTVYDFSLFEGYIPSKDSEIPDGGAYTIYNLLEYAPDYLAATELARDGADNPIIGCRICCAKLYIPSTFTGEIRLRYKKAAPRIFADNKDETIDIPREIEHLVPLLTAAYVWLDDDPDKAQYYMSLYREGISALKLYDRTCISTQFTDVTGWAK